MGNLKEGWKMKRDKWWKGKTAIFYDYDGVKCIRYFMTFEEADEYAKRLPTRCTASFMNLEPT